jgi:hypothetical protein
MKPAFFAFTPKLRYMDLANDHKFPCMVFTRDMIHYDAAGPVEVGLEEEDTTGSYIVHCSDFSPICPGASLSLSLSLCSLSSTLMHILICCMYTHTASSSVHCALD